MNIVLWILQGLLAGVHLAAGLTKLTRTKEQLAPQMGYVEDFPETTITAIGGAEVAAAIGLILPAVTGIATVLTPLAATGLVLLMAGAVFTHVRRDEPQAAVVAAVLLLLAAVVVWGRFGVYSF